MTKQEEYVENAVESLELAERLASSSDRRRMLKLAEAWVELAKSSSPFEVIAASPAPTRSVRYRVDPSQQGITGPLASARGPHLGAIEFRAGAAGALA
jgi:hypothetical protein